MSPLYAARRVDRQHGQSDPGDVERDSAVRRPERRFRCGCWSAPPARGLLGWIGRPGCELFGSSDAVAFRQREPRFGGW